MSDAPITGLTDEDKAQLDRVALDVATGFDSDSARHVAVDFLRSILARGQKCPTCGGTGPDPRSLDFDTGMLEVDCGDEWHDSETAPATPAPIARCPRCDGAKMVWADDPAVLGVGVPCPDCGGSGTAISGGTK